MKWKFPIPSKSDYKFSYPPTQIIMPLVDDSCSNNDVDKTFFTAEENEVIHQQSYREYGNSFVFQEEIFAFFKALEWIYQ